MQGLVVELCVVFEVAVSHLEVFNFERPQADDPERESPVTVPPLVYLAASKLLGNGLALQFSITENSPAIFVILPRISMIRILGLNELSNVLVVLRLLRKVAHLGVLGTESPLLGLLCILNEVLRILI